MALKLTREQINELQLVLKDDTLDTQLTNKAKIILEYTFTDCKDKVVEINNTSQRSIQRWINRYNNEGIEGLKDKEFKKQKVLTEDKIKNVLPWLAKNPMDYGLIYSVWDKNTLRQLITEHPKFGVNTSDTTLNKILNTANNKFGNLFKGIYCDDIKYFKNEINKLVIKEHCICAYCKDLYLGKKSTQIYTPKKYGNQPNQIRAIKSDAFTYYHGIVISVSNGDYYTDTIATTGKGFNVENKINLFMDIMKIVPECDSRYCIVVDTSLSTRNAIQHLYERNCILNNIFFLTIPISIQQELKSFEFARNVKRHVTTNEKESKKNIHKLNYSIDDKICFNNKSLDAIDKNFKILINRVLDS